MSIYKTIILNHYRHPRNAGRLENPDRTAKRENPLCGDRITMDVRLGHGHTGSVQDIRFAARGCAISIAAASLLTEAAKGKSKKEILKLDKEFVLKKLGVKLSPNRLKCALLPLEALQEAAGKGRK